MNQGPYGQTEEPFMTPLIRDLDDTISALERHQVLVFYEAVGCMIDAEKDPGKQQSLLSASVCCDKVD